MEDPDQDQATVSNGPPSRLPRPGPPAVCAAWATWTAGAVMAAAGLVVAASVGSPLINRWMNERKAEHQAKDEITALVEAVKDYQTDYHSNPPLPFAELGADVTGPEGVRFLEDLLGSGPHGKVPRDNSRRIDFLAMPAGNHGKGGLIFDKRSGKVTGLTDPWGHPYRVWMDEVWDGRLTVDGGVTVEDEVAVRSDGPDGKPGTKDDVKSW